MKPYVVVVVVVVKFWEPCVVVVVVVVKFFSHVWLWLWLAKMESYNTGSSVPASGTRCTKATMKLNFRGPAGAVPQSFII